MIKQKYFYLIIRKESKLLIKALVVSKSFGIVN